MLRKFALAIATLALPFGTAAPVSAEINLHNGYIIVINHVKVLEKDGDPWKGPLRLQVVLNHVMSLANFQEIGHVGQGETITMNDCCIAAGSPYSFKIVGEDRVKAPILYFHPRLCNIRGIPFGFATIVITGTLQRIPNNWEVTNFHAQDVDAPCPHG